MPAAASADGCPGASCPYAAVTAIGLSGHGVFRFPQAVAVGPDGNIWVGDDHSYLVQEFTPAGNFLRQFGGYGHSPGRFGVIGGLAVDGTGDVWVLDAGNSRVQKLTPDGTPLLAFGRHGSANGRFDLRYHGGITLGAGSVWVSDANNNRIQRFDLAGNLQQILGGFGSGPGQLASPQGLTFAGGRLFVADDHNHRVQIYDANGAFVGGFGSYGTGAGQFRYPYGVALDPLGNIFVADNNNHRVEEFSPSLGFLRAFGAQGMGFGQLGFPRSIATDQAGNVIVGDTSGNRVETFSGLGVPIGAFGISGRAPGNFVFPTGLGSDSQGNLLVADTLEFRIQRLTTSGAFLSAFGQEGKTRAHFKAPEAIAGAPDGSFYVGDRKLSRVAHLDAGGHFLRDLSPKGLSQPHGVAVNAQGTVFVADTGHDRVVRYVPGDAPIAVYGGLPKPVGVAAGPSGSFVTVTGADQLVSFGGDGRVIARAGGKGSGPGQMNHPGGVTIAPSGTVYVTDGSNARVEMFTLLGKYLGTWGEPGDAPGQFQKPSGVTADAAGDVFVSDPFANRVEIFTPGGAPPQAQAAAPVRRILSLKTLRFTGSATDPAGAALALEWDFGDGHFAAGHKVHHRFDRPGLYDVALRASNPLGRVGAATVRVRIIDRRPTATLRITPRHVLRGQAVHLTALHARDRDGRITNFTWDVDGSGELTRDTGTVPRTIARVASTGRHRLRVRILDDSGGSATRGALLIVELGPLLSVSPRAVSHGKRVTLSVRCPRTLSRRCRGSVALLANGRVIGTALVNLRRGLSGHVTVVRHRALRTPLSVRITTRDDAGAARHATRRLTLR